MNNSLWWTVLQSVHAECISVCICLVGPYGVLTRFKCVPQVSFVCMCDLQVGSGAQLCALAACHCPPLNSLTLLVSSGLISVSCTSCSSSIFLSRHLKPLCPWRRREKHYTQWQFGNKNCTLLEHHIRYHCFHKWQGQLKARQVSLYHSFYGLLKMSGWNSS